jgi:hypothetical protein
VQEALSDDGHELIVQLMLAVRVTDGAEQKPKSDRTQHRC